MKMAKKTDKKTAQQQNDVERQLIGYARQTEEEIFRQFSTCEDGLNPVEASERLEEHGRNIIVLRAGGGGDAADRFYRRRRAVRPSGHGSRIRSVAGDPDGGVLPAGPEP